MLAVAGGDFDFALAVEGLAGVLQQIDQDAGEVLSLHEDGGEIGGVVALDADLVFGGGGEDLKDGVVNFGGDLQALDTPLGQLGVAHQDGEDLVGAADFLADDGDLLLDGEFAVVDGALEAEGGVGDDAEGIFDFMGDFGGEAAGGAETFLADGEFGGFGLGALLLFKENLDAVAAGGPNNQDEDALIGVFVARLNSGVAYQQFLVQESSRRRCATGGMETLSPEIIVISRTPPAM